MGGPTANLCGRYHCNYTHLTITCLCSDRYHTLVFWIVRVEYGVKVSLDVSASIVVPGLELRYYYRAAFLFFPVR